MSNTLRETWKETLTLTFGTVKFYAQYALLSKATRSTLLWLGVMVYALLLVNMPFVGMMLTLLGMPVWAIMALSRNVKISVKVKRS